MYREAASWGSVENPPEFLKMFESNPPDGPTIAASLLAADWNWFISRRKVSISPTDRVCPWPSFANRSPICGIFGLVFRRRHYCHVPGPLILEFLVPSQAVPEAVRPLQCIAGHSLGRIKQLHQLSLQNSS